MPPAGQLKPPLEERLSDRVAIGALTATFPPELVDRVLAQTGKREQRRRLLPARMVVYYLLALALFADVAYLEVLRLLVEALRRPARRRRAALAPRLPVKSALVQARVRLGPEPLRALFAQAARPLATPATAGAWYRGWRLGAVDGTTLDVADTPANEAAFGRAKSGRGEGVGAFPQVRVVGLVECGTHATVGAVLGSYPTGEVTLAGRLLGGLEEGVLAGVLVLEYRQDDPGRPQAAGEVYRLVTTILDPTAAPAHELAALYAQRWEQETVLDELKTHQRGAQVVLRSKSPEMVEQEDCSHLLVHYAIRKLMHQAALDEGLDPDRLSFTGSLRIVRRHLASHAAFSP